jgi:hypothetical protein
MPFETFRMTDWKDRRSAAALQALDIGWYPPPGDDSLIPLSRLQMLLIYWKLPNEVNELFGLNRRDTTAMSGEDGVKRIEPRAAAVAG